MPLKLRVSTSFDPHAPGARGRGWPVAAAFRTLLRMAFMYACPPCSCHVREGDRVCPHCEPSLVIHDATTARIAAAAVIGLATVLTYALGGCGGRSTSGTGGSTTATTSFQVADTFQVAELTRADHFP